MSNPPIPPVVPGLLAGDDDDAVDRPDVLAGGDDAPLDPDVDDDAVDSAEADERAATEGTLDGESDVDDRP
jgi:hypothetical protein